MSTKIARLNSGEEIICDLEFDESPDGSFYILKKPCIIIPTGQGQIGLMPWLGYGDIGTDGVKVKESFVAFTFDPSNELRNEYSTAFGSGLVVPASDVIGAGGPMGSDAPALKLTD
tara:strand:+ start:7078 stop:7425 length:348 start_codon:yes stop_codon:yes gene_type:complete